MTLEFDCCVGVCPEHAVELSLDLFRLATGPLARLTFASELSPEEVWQLPFWLILLSDDAALAFRPASAGS
jgi:hypothetical protein